MLGKQYQAPNFSNRVNNEKSSEGKINKLVKEQGVKQGLAELENLLARQIVDVNVLETVGLLLRLEGKLSVSVVKYEANVAAFRMLRLFTFRWRSVPDARG